jgi:UDPglucose 6-dehydrogenase
MLLDAGAKVQAFDPQAMEASQAEIPELSLCQTPYKAADGADALLLATEWNQFKSLDFEKIKAGMSGDVILDGRNLWDGEALAALGFRYYGVGVPSQGN